MLPQYRIWTDTIEWNKYGERLNICITKVGAS